MTRTGFEVLESSCDPFWVSPAPLSALHAACYAAATRVTTHSGENFYPTLW